MTGKVTVQFDIEDLIKARELIAEMESPKVKFTGDIETMREEANELSSKALYNLDGLLKSYVG